MPKGKTNQPLVFMIPEEWNELEVFKALLDQGHKVINLPPECINADIVFGVNCHVMTDEMVNAKGILDLALRAARKRKKAKKNEDSA